MTSTEQMKAQDKKVSGIVTLEEKVEDVIEEVKALPVEKQELIAKTVTRTRFSGPIPPPETLQKYEHICPGAADRIITMAEKQVEHRIDCERILVSSEVGDSKRGQWIGCGLAGILIVFGFVLILFDKNTYGMVAIVGAIVSLVGVFVYGRKTAKEERDENETGEGC